MEQTAENPNKNKTFKPTQMRSHRDILLAIADNSPGTTYLSGVWICWMCGLMLIAFVECTYWKTLSIILLWALRLEPYTNKQGATHMEPQLKNTTPRNKYACLR